VRETSPPDWGFKSTLPSVNGGVEVPPSAPRRFFFLKATIVIAITDVIPTLRPRLIGSRFCTSLSLLPSQISPKTNKPHQGSVKTHVFHTSHSKTQPVTRDQKDKR
jgi:hypothetical protein